MKQPWQPGYKLNINILEINRRIIADDWDARDVCSSYWRFYVNKRDGASIRLEDNSLYPIRAQQLYLLPAWLGFSCVNTRSIDHFYIHFDLAGLPGVLIRQLFPMPIALQTTNAIRPLLRSLQREPWHQMADGMAVTCRILALVNLAMGQAWESLLSSQALFYRSYLLGTHQLSGVLQFIEEHLHMPLDNARLAEHCHLSRDHFVRRFSQEIGQTPAQYIRERRVARAAQLLRFGDQAIDQIAEQCGFADRFHFSRIFSRIMGSPPAAYRKGKHV